MGSLLFDGTDNAVHEALAVALKVAVAKHRVEVFGNLLDDVLT